MQRKENMETIPGSSKAKKAVVRRRQETHGETAA